MLALHEIRRRMTETNAPSFGFCWHPLEKEKKEVNRIVSQLEDKGIFFSPVEPGLSHHCIKSINEVRTILPAETIELEIEKAISSGLQSILTAFKVFLEETNVTDSHWNCRSISTVNSWVFSTAAGDLGGIFGAYHSKIAVSFSIDITKDFTRISLIETKDEMKEHRYS